MAFPHPKATSGVFFWMIWSVLARDFELSYTGSDDDAMITASEFGESKAAACFDLVNTLIKMARVTEGLMFDRIGPHEFREGTQPTEMGSIFQGYEVPRLVRVFSTTPRCRAAAGSPDGVCNFERVGPDWCYRTNVGMDLDGLNCRVLFDEQRFCGLLLCWIVYQTNIPGWWMYLRPSPLLLVIVS